MRKITRKSLSRARVEISHTTARTSFSVAFPRRRSFREKVWLIASGRRVTFSPPPMESIRSTHYTPDARPQIPSRHIRRDERSVAGAFRASHTHTKAERIIHLRARGIIGISLRSQNYRLGTNRRCGTATCWTIYIQIAQIPSELAEEASDR